MSRPNNLIVSVNGMMYSVSPKNLKTVLANVSRGSSLDTELDSLAKKLGGLETTLPDNLSANDAADLLKRLFPERVAPTALPTVSEFDDMTGADILMVGGQMVRTTN